MYSRIMAPLLVVTVCALLALPAGAHLSQGTAAGVVGPFPERVLALLNMGATRFVLASHGHAIVSKQSAIHAAQTQFPGSTDQPNGMSLARTTKNAPTARRELVWLISFHVSTPLAPGRQTRKPRKRIPTTQYFFVAVNAKTGQWVSGGEGCQGPRCPPGGKDQKKMKLPA